MLFIKSLAGALLDKPDHALELLHGVFVRLLILPAHRDRRDGGRDVEPAVDQLAVHGGGVTGHVVHDEAGTVAREVISNGDARGGRAQTAAVCRKTIAFHNIQIVDRKILIHIAAEQTLERLQRHWRQVRKSTDNLARHRLLQKHLFSRDLVFPEASVALHHLGDGRCRAVHDGVQEHVRGAKRRTADALRCPIDHRKRRKIGAEPAVFQHATGNAHRTFGDKFHQNAKVHDPLQIVIRRIAQSAPLPVPGDVRLVIKPIARAFFIAVGIQPRPIHPCFPP